MERKKPTPRDVTYTGDRVRMTDTAQKRPGRTPLHEQSNERLAEKLERVVEKYGHLSPPVVAEVARRLRRAEQDFQECFAAMESYRKELDRLRAPQREGDREPDWPTVMDYITDLQAAVVQLQREVGMLDTEPPAERDPDVQAALDLLNAADVHLSRTLRGLEGGDEASRVGVTQSLEEIRTAMNCLRATPDTEEDQP